MAGTYGQFFVFFETPGLTLRSGDGGGPVHTEQLSGLVVRPDGVLLQSAERGPMLARWADIQRIQRTRRDSDGLSSHPGYRLVTSTGPFTVLGATDQIDGKFWEALGSLLVEFARLFAPEENASPVPTGVAVPQADAVPTGAVFPAADAVSTTVATPAAPSDSASSSEPTPDPDGVSLAEGRRPHDGPMSGRRRWLWFLGVLLAVAPSAGVVAWAWAGPPSKPSASNALQLISQVPLTSRDLPAFHAADSGSVNAEPLLSRPAAANQISDFAECAGTTTEMAGQLFGAGILPGAVEDRPSPLLSLHNVAAGLPATMVSAEASDLPTSTVSSYVDLLKSDTFTGCLDTLMTRAEIMLVRNEVDSAAQVMPTTDNATVLPGPAGVTISEWSEHYTVSTPAGSWSYEMDMVFFLTRTMVSVETVSTAADSAALIGQTTALLGHRLAVAQSRLDRQPSLHRYTGVPPS